MEASPSSHLCLSPDSLVHRRRWRVMMRTTRWRRRGRLFMAVGRWRETWRRRDGRCHWSIHTEQTILRWFPSNRSQSVFNRSSNVNFLRVIVIIEKRAGKRTWLFHVRRQWNRGQRRVALGRTARRVHWRDTVVIGRNFKFGRETFV